MMEDSTMGTDTISFSSTKAAPETIKVTGEEGRILLSIFPDGRVVGEIEDASEAARVFVNSLRRILAAPTIQ